MATLREAQDKFQAKSEEAFKFYNGFKKNADNQPDMTAADVEKFQALNQELDDVAKEFEGLKSVEVARRELEARTLGLKSHDPSRPLFGQGASGDNERGGHLVSQKTAGEMFTEAEAYTQTRGSYKRAYGVDLAQLDPQEFRPEATAAIKSHTKATMTTTAGISAPNPRGPRIVDFAVRRPMVADLIPSDTTDLSVIKFIEITTFNNMADTVAESGTKPEAALAGTERSNNVEVIAVTLPVTQQQLDDVPGIRAFIDRMLTTMLQLAEEDQILNGSGVSPDLMGFHTHASVQAQALGADTRLDALFKAMQKVRSIGFAEPSAFILHPDDWTDVRLAKTADGIYLMGAPNEEGADRVWGKPVVITTAETAGTGLTGDFQLWAHISRKMGIRIDVGWVNDQFLKNQQTLRGEMRESLEIFRPTAFCEITGL